MSGGGKGANHAEAKRRQQRTSKSMWPCGQEYWRPRGPARRSGGLEGRHAPPRPGTVKFTARCHSLPQTQLLAGRLDVAETARRGEPRYQLNALRSISAAASQVALSAWFASSHSPAGIVGSGISSTLERGRNGIQGACVTTLYTTRSVVNILTLVPEPAAVWVTEVRRLGPSVRKVY